MRRVSTLVRMLGDWDAEGFGDSGGKSDLGCGHDLGWIDRVDEDLGD